MLKTGDKSTVQQNIFKVNSKSRVTRNIFKSWHLLATKRLFLYLKLTENGHRDLL